MSNSFALYSISETQAVILLLLIVGALVILAYLIYFSLKSEQNPDNPPQENDKWVRKR